MIRRLGLCAALLLGACDSTQDNSQTVDQAVRSDALTAWLSCEADTTAISRIQGTGPASTLLGDTVSARGVVTHRQAGAGFYLQSEWPEDARGASQAIFIASDELAATVTEGDLIVASGTVQELGEGPDTLTSLVRVDGFAVCGSGHSVPQTDARLPLTPTEREAIEGMQVLIEQPLTISDVYAIRDAEVTVSALGVAVAPTESVPPGEEALAALRKIQNWSLQVFHESLSKLEPLQRAHAGALVNELAGVMGNIDGNQVLLADQDIQPISLPRAAPVDKHPGEVRIVGFNIYQYFNGDGLGGGFPAPRGPRTLEEFQRLSAGIVAAVSQIQPDILGVIEIENDGFGPHSAIQSLRQELSQTAGIEFSVARPIENRVGGDAIAVGLLYRSDRLEAVGPARQFDEGVFEFLNRAPLAQLFKDLETGSRFLVVVNHFKSKGYCPETGPNIDLGDGQSCWNASRTTASQILLRWVQTIAEELQVDAYILLGDFNAYRKEDPIRLILENGLVELVERHSGLPQYSYIYRGMAGTLDYAFASEAFAVHTTRAFIWNINAAFPWSANPAEPWLRSSDHDPVIVDVRFNQSVTSD